MPHAAEALWKTFDKHANRLDILVNNAGEVVYGRVSEVSEDDFDRLFAVNVKAPLFIIQHGLSRLQDWGPDHQCIVGSSLSRQPDGDHVRGDQRGDQHLDPHHRMGSWQSPDHRFAS
jgi:NAD(P)-dependent dehydrogenase (short-subunit alcohol dehydrogenase family)